MLNGIVKVDCSGDKVIIEIDKSDMLICLNNHPVGYRIIDENAFFNYLEENLTEINESGDEYSDFYKLFDDLVSNAYEDDRDFVMNPEWYEDELSSWQRRICEGEN